VNAYRVMAGCGRNDRLALLVLAAYARAKPCCCWFYLACVPVLFYQRCPACQLLWYISQQFVYEWIKWDYYYYYYYSLTSLTVTS